MWLTTVCIVSIAVTGSIVCGSADEEQLRVEVLELPESCERRSEEGDMLSMKYRGTLESDGSEFDASREEPFSFQLGKNQVIPGWEQGLKDMCIGEKRRLHVPSHLAYGDKGAGERIPPNAALVFEVELVNITDSPPPVNVFKMIDANDDSMLSREEVSEYLIRQVPENMKEEQSFDQDQLVEEIFQHEDKDRNGFITHEEFSGPKHDEL